MLSPHWNLDFKGEDSTLFTLVFLGLEISMCGRKEQREERKKAGKEE